MHPENLRRKSFSMILLQTQMYILEVYGGYERLSTNAVILYFTIIQLRNKSPEASMNSRSSIALSI